MSNEMVEDGLMEVPPVIVMDGDTDETAETAEKPQKRFVQPGSSEDIDSLAAERQSRLTITQTRWAVKIFRGEFSTIFYKIMYWNEWGGGEPKKTLCGHVLGGGKSNSGGEGGGKSISCVLGGGWLLLNISVTIDFA